MCGTDRALHMAEPVSIPFLALVNISIQGVEIELRQATR
jgi:hypothetical protein